jgi:hypothetical protein
MSLLNGINFYRIGGYGMEEDGWARERNGLFFFFLVFILRGLKLHVLANNEHQALLNFVDQLICISMTSLSNFFLHISIKIMFMLEALNLKQILLYEFLGTEVLQYLGRLDLFTWIF